MAHHGEGATFAWAAGKAQVFVIQRLPEPLQQAGELFGRDPGARFVEQFDADPQLLQQTRIVIAASARATEGRTSKMTGDGTFAHWGLIRPLSGGS